MAADYSRPGRDRIGYDLQMRLADLVAASAAVAASSSRLDKIGHLAAALSRLRSDEIAIVIPFLTGTTRQGRVGIGQSILTGIRGVDAAHDATLEIREVDATFARVAALSGAGSLASRAEVLRDLFRRATRDEQEFLLRLLFGELRQGALEGVLVDAVATRGEYTRGAHPPRRDARRRPRAGRAAPHSPKASRRCRDSSSSRFVPCSRCWPTRPPT